MKKLLTWLGVVMAAIWVIHNPGAADADLQSFVRAVTTLADHL